jgi:zinc protease
MTGRSIFSPPYKSSRIRMAWFFIFLTFSCPLWTRAENLAQAINSAPIVTATGSSNAQVVELRLKNGLKVLMWELHTTPLVSVWTWYRVGSKDEALGESGISHWVEHMNFKGTRDISKTQMKKMIENGGGEWNGFTSLDQTAYFSTLSSSALEDALRLEAERMWLSQFAPEEVQNERTVILSELAEAESDPRNVLDIEATSTALRLHPYRWPVLGWRTDLAQITRDQLYQHYLKYYHPGNAILVIAGDFEPRQTETLVRKYFETIPSSPEPRRYSPLEPEQEGERRLKLLREGNTPYLEIAFRAPEILNDDFFALLILDAALCGAKGVNLMSSPLEANAGGSSRLYRALVDKKLATYVNSELLPSRHPYLYKLYLTLPDIGQFQPAEEAVYDELEKIKTYGLSNNEIQKTRNQLLARHYLDQDSLSKRAHQLGFFESIASQSLLDQFESKLNRVTPDDLRRVAINYLPEKGRTVAWFLPQPRQRKVEVEKLSKLNPSADRSTPIHPFDLGRHLRPAFQSGGASGASTANPVPLKIPRIALQPQRRVLSNGVIVEVAVNPASPTVYLAAAVKAGAMREEDVQAGTANFVGEMLERGTKTRTAQQLAEALEFRGIQLEVDTDYLKTTLAFSGLSRDFAVMADNLADVLRNAVFPAGEVEKVRAGIFTRLKEDLDNPAIVAEAALRERVYPPGHPFRRQVMGSFGTVEPIRVSDLTRFYKRYYRPEQLIVVVSGDVNPVEVFEQLESRLGSWRGEGTADSFYIPAVQPGLGSGSQIVPLAAKAQCEIAFGMPGISIHHPDYYAMLILNYIMGEAGMGGRIGNRVRDEEGLAYHISSSLDANWAEGLWMVQAGTSPENVEKVCGLIREEIGKIKADGISSQEIDAAKSYLMYSLPRQLESNEGIVPLLLEVEFFQLGEGYLSRYPDLIAGVSKEKLMDCWRTRLNFEKAALVIAGGTVPRTPAP